MAPAALLATGLLALSGVHQRADTSGCGKDHWFTSVTRYKSLTSNGTKRDFNVHLPSDYDKNVQYPVVLGFHGSDRWEAPSQSGTFAHGSSASVSSLR